jgi:hypothetical protein
MRPCSPIEKFTEVSDQHMPPSSASKTKPSKEQAEHLQLKLEAVSSCENLVNIRATRRHIADRTSHQSSVCSLEISLTPFWFLPYAENEVQQLTMRLRDVRLCSSLQLLIKYFAKEEFPESVLQVACLPVFV